MCRVSNSSGPESINCLQWGLGWVGKFGTLMSASLHKGGRIVYVHLKEVSRKKTDSREICPRVHFVIVSFCSHVLFVLVSFCCHVLLFSRPFALVPFSSSALLFSGPAVLMSFCYCVLYSLLSCCSHVLLFSCPFVLRSCCSHVL